MAEAEECCSFSLMCLEDGADLDAGLADDGELLLLCGGAGVEDDEEYMDHLVSKESSFCCSPSSSSSPSSPAFSSDFSDAGAESPSPSPMTTSDDWFRCARRDTVKWILETRAWFGFSHRTAYLAIAYFDRFCLRRCFDASVMPWAARLLAVACASLAAKMEEYRAPPLPEYQADDQGRGFTSASIRRMELLVLSTLEWRMGGVTPFDYLPCLASRLRRRGGGGAGGLAAAADLIFSAAKAASVLDYRPSTVAVAAVLAATHGAMAKEAMESKISSLSPSSMLDKEDVYACHIMMLSESESSSPAPATSNRAKRPPPSTPDSTGAGGAYESSSSSSFAAAASSNSNKRARLMEAVGR
ncbi:unnamed protein product [Urochloa decumbens]|uniref:Cyclin-like domain-containing protein n=1 Tax=Urochloa decumbens TaxID=240449 RepID=A0ABC8XJG9_9POAL